MLLNFIILAGWQLSKMAISWMEIFPGGNCPSGNFFSGIVQVRVIVGGNFPGRNCLGGIILIGSYSGGSNPGWEFSLVGIFLVGTISGENFHVTEMEYLELRASNISNISNTWNNRIFQSIELCNCYVGII